MIRGSMMDVAGVGGEMPRRIPIEYCSDIFHASFHSSGHHSSSSFGLAE